MSVTVVPIESVEEIEKTHPRQGKFRFRRLLKGVDGSPNNFTFEMSRTFPDFYSPRHKHNFDQFRYQIEGDFSFSRDGKSKPGTLIYHPESAPYGPQSSDEEAVVLVLQFGGASGNGYVSSTEQRRAIEELEKTGSFKNGVFTRVDENGKKVNKDAFEAVWEHVNGRPIEYAKPRYQGPIFMHPENYAWVPVEGSPGVAAKMMGVFTERRTEAGFLRLEAGASCALIGPKIYFVTAGEGMLGKSPVRKHTSIHVEAGDTASIEAKAPLEMLFLGLPDFTEGELRQAA
jgi:hypothetical protein